MLLAAGISGLGTLFGARKERKAQDKENKRLLEEQRQQRSWDVEDRDKARAFDLEDRTARQSLLNPYAAYFKGERLAKPVGPDVALTLPAPVAPVGGDIVYSDRNDYSRFRTQLR